MKNLGNLIFLALVIIGGYLYRDKLETVYLTSLNHYFPCKFAIEYSIGTFDNRFGISEQDFLASLKEAESIWETAINKDLFNYSPNGDLKINLIYDKRQETTEQLKFAGVEVENSRASYDSLKSKYDSLIKVYEQTKAVYESKIANFELRKSKYESEVANVNKRGGGNKETVNRLNAEKEYLNSEIRAINELQANLNSQGDAINSLIKTLNSLAISLNINVKQYNEIGGSLGEEFEEGLYIQDSSGRRIEIYQFENENKLVRVLAHELGHALGLEHNNDSKAIMYRLNVGTNEKPSSQDIKDLKSLCKIE